MAKLTAAERADLEARLKADDDDDEDDQVTIAHEGRSFTGSFRRARGVARSWGIRLEEDPPAKDDDDGSDGGGQVKRFTAGRRTG